MRDLWPILTSLIFSILVTYSLSAMLTVFNYIRQNPLGDQAWQDLELLRAPANTILQSMGPGEPNSPKVVEIRQLLGYLIEMGRVARDERGSAEKQRSA